MTPLLCRPIIIAAVRRSAEAVELLAEHGAKLWPPGPNGFSLLLEACSGGLLSLAKRIVAKYPESLDYVDRNGNGPVRSSCFFLFSLSLFSFSPHLLLS